MFHQDIQTLGRELKIRHAAEHFCLNSRCLIADETLSQVFDISSQSKQKSSKSMLIKTRYANLLHGCDFLCVNLMNY